MKFNVWLVCVVLLLAGCGESAGSLEDSTDTSSENSTDTSSTDSEDSTDSDSDSGPPDCEVVGCEEVPGDTCDSEGNLLVYTGASVCVDHVCQYEFSIELCDFGCIVDGDNTRCKADLCDGVVCAEVEAACDTNPNNPGWLNTDYVMYCQPDTGECVEDRHTPVYCGDRKGCVSVSGADDYCDTEVFTPCETEEDCGGNIPSTCEETEEGAFITSYWGGVCDTDGSLTGTEGACSYQEELRDVSVVGCP